MSAAAACFNNECHEAKSERRKKGWRLRNGDHAELCDLCASAFEEGKFCGIFHQHVAGWRYCESCGKPVHCGCIVSAHTFVLLDAGGVNCIECARKISILTQNQACSPPSWSSMTPADLHKLNQRLNGTGSNGSLRQATHLKFSAQTELQPARPCLGFIHEEKHSLCVRSGIPVIVKDQAPVSRYGLASASCSELENQSRASITQQLSTSLTGNPLRPTSNNGMDSSGKIHKNFNVRADINSQNQVYSWYCHKISDRELQQISGDSNSAITPLFEKMLSASDAGRVGRLVLPKKCAETYFPSISGPEGLPLRIQDVKGQEWTFQFRFWPNNNSRMYVLEGVTPCIQSMELQAGDTVTFSRLEPEGKLIMGYRKAASIPTCNQVDKVTPVDLQSKVDKSYAVKEALGGKTYVSKRRSGIVGSTIKRMKLDTVSLIELKVTLEEAQGLLRPHIDHVPKVVLVEDFEFEEYEDAPVIGRPTIITKASVGHCIEEVQWAQCDSCCKWRRILPYILPPAGWTCSDNSWDPERSSCIAAQELNNGQLEDLLNNMNSANCKKRKATKPNPDPGEASNDPPAATISSTMPKEDLYTEQHEHVIFGTNSAGSKKSKGAELDIAPAECSDGLHTFTKLGLLGEGETVSTLAQATSKHPRHRPGCSCIVCIQPPSGKGPKHVSTCTCNVCVTVRRRFQTMMMRREKKKLSGSSDKAESAEFLVCSNPEMRTANVEGSTNNTPSKKPSTSAPAKGHFDLNIQPEREELSPHSNPGNVINRFVDYAMGEPSKTLNEGVNLE